MLLILVLVLIYCSSLCRSIIHFVSQKLRYETKKSVSDGVDEIGGDAHYAAAAAQGQAPGAALEFNEHRNNSTKFRRPLLIINHNAKAGGGSILETIREFKSCEIKAKVNGNAIRDILV